MLICVRPRRCAILLRSRPSPANPGRAFAGAKQCFASGSPACESSLRKPGCMLIYLST